MGKKLKHLGFTAGRWDGDSILPTDLTLVWHKRTPEFGPNDFLLSEHPELHWAFDPTIADAIPEEHVTLALTKKEDGCYIGIITPIGYRKVEIAGKLRLVVVFGRGRTRMGREANRRIAKAGGTIADYVMVPARIRDTDDVGAALERDIENLHRKEMSPLAIARLAKYHVDKGTPEHLLLKACKVTTMAAVQNYLRLLERPKEVQAMVDRRELPLTEGLRVTAAEAPKVVAAVEKKGKLTARQSQEARGVEPTSKMMPRGQIEKWAAACQDRGTNARLVEAVLRTVLGTGDMSEHKHLAPPKKS